jgi:hypothetical protein
MRLLPFQAVWCTLRLVHRPGWPPFKTGFAAFVASAEKKSAGFEFFLQEPGIKFRLLIMRGKMQTVRAVAESRYWMRNR